MLLQEETRVSRERKPAVFGRVLLVAFFSHVSGNDNQAIVYCLTCLVWCDLSSHKIFQNDLDVYDHRTEL